MFHQQTNRTAAARGLPGRALGGRLVAIQHLTDQTVNGAFERKGYATFSFRATPGKKHEVLFCWVTLPSGEEKNCQSPDEFAELIKVYMGGVQGAPPTGSAKKGSE